MGKLKTTELDYKNISDDVYEKQGNSINKILAKNRYKVLAVENNEIMECRKWK